MGIVLTGEVEEAVGSQQLAVCCPPAGRRQDGINKI
jgi:hypothetical protein